MRLRYAAAIAAASLALVPGFAHAVNLVPNPSFESFTSCPTGYGQINVAAPWNTPNTGTSDHLNACAPATFPSVNVPNTEMGFQAAQNGVGFAGLIPYSSAPDYREYIQAPLNSPLVAGTPYTVSFYVSCADIALYTVDRLGAYFSVGAVGPVPNYAALPYTPQVESPVNVQLANSTGWTLITGTFVAAGGEDHIIIGSFHDDATTNTGPGPGTWPGYSYYFVDGVNVEVALPVEQACCMSDGTCSMQFPGECQFLGGSPGGPGTTCVPQDPCGSTGTRKGTWGELKIRYR